MLFPTTKKYKTTRLRIAMLTYLVAKLNRVANHDAIKSIWQPRIFSGITANENRGFISLRPWDSPKNVVATSIALSVSKIAGNMMKLFF
jgi:hypothetical protein